MEPNMPSCEGVHKQYEKYANRELQKGTLPPWMHVSGRVVYYVFQGPYSGLPAAWSSFGEKMTKMQDKFAGPPGDVYVCDPTEHKGKAEEKLLTILWAPLKE